MSRLWSDPPLKPDGTLDYSRLTVAEIGEDLQESLKDRVINGGLGELQPFLEDLPELQTLPGSPAPGILVDLMERLLTLEASDPDFNSPETREVIHGAIVELHIVSHPHP